MAQERPCFSSIWDAELFTRAKIPVTAPKSTVGSDSITKDSAVRAVKTMNKMFTPLENRRANATFASSRSSTGAEHE